MYIDEAIRRADAIAPNEYTREEKYAWCDELTAMLSQEYLKKYGETEIEQDVRGEYLLPEGITFEMVEKIIAEKNELEKRDFRSYGIKPLYGLRKRIYIPESRLSRGKIRVIYIMQSEPIRTVNKTVTDASVESNAINFDMSNMSGKGTLCEGDAVNITLKEDDGTEHRYELLSILGIYDESVDLKMGAAVKLLFTDHVFEDMAGKTAAECIIERVVTDETICQPPYDELYVDFMCAKIAYHQRNYTVYNQLMNVFNQRLRAYHNWLMERSVSDKDNRMRNWW